MPQWIHDRAMHLRRKNPDMPKSEAFAIATYERQALEGELLGDGSVFIRKRYANAAFQLQSAYEGQVRFAHNALKYFGGSPISFVRKAGGFSPRDHLVWMFKTNVSESLTDIRDRWYPHGTKTVPADFELSPVAALHWYLGDGSLHPHQAQIVLCTDCFDDLSCARLRDQLRQNGVETGIRARGRIGITGSDVEKFLLYIGPCPVAEHAHKWAVVVRKYTTKRCSSAEVALMNQLRTEGRSYEHIGARLGRTAACVWEHTRRSKGCA